MLLKRRSSYAVDYLRGQPDRSHVSYYLLTDELINVLSLTAVLSLFGFPSKLLALQCRSHRRICGVSHRRDAMRCNFASMFILTREKKMP